jgi:PucR C-terminal helix-turn-helix domain/GGDEF-like domain
MTTAASEWILRLDATDPAALEPACGAATLAAATEHLGPGPVRWAVQTAASMTAEIIEKVPEHGGGPAPFETLRRAVEATTLMGLAGLLANGSPLTGMIAPEAVEGNAELARRGIPLDRVLRGVRIGHAHLHRELMAAIEREPPETQSTEMHRVTDLLFSYADMQASVLAEEYIAERDRWRTSTEAARRRMVEDILAGRRVREQTAIRVLGYDLSQRHVALVIWGDGPEASAESAYRFAAEVARTAGADRLLTVPAGPSRLWAWAGWASGPSARTGANMGALLAPPPQLRVASGPVALGAAGFRRSHLGACEAERIARVSGRQVCAYPAIRVAALATADSEHAEWFVRELLGALAADDERCQELRETLRVYLAEGRSPQRAGAKLHVSRNTVTYRAKQAQDMLPDPAAADFEVWLALEAARVLPDADHH